MVPFGEDVAVPVTLRLRRSIITWVNADASESADKRLLQRAMPGRDLLHVVATKEHTVVERPGSGKAHARFWWRDGATRLPFREFRGGEYTLR